MRWILWLKREFLHILPIFLFFLISFTLINWIQAYLFERVGVTPFKFLEVAIAAALIAKIVLVADHLPIIHLFRKQPLIYGIFWKTGFYWILLLIVRLAVRFVPFLFDSGTSFQNAVDRFIAISNWNLFISIQLYYLMLLFIFVTFEELAFKIGTRKMRRLFFGAKKK